MRTLLTTLLLLGIFISADAQDSPTAASAPLSGLQPYSVAAATALPTATGETTVRHRYTLGRERTLFGDLDLSGLWGGPTYNYSATGDDWALVRGGFGGLELDETVFIGYGGWSSRDPFTTDDATAAGTSPKYDFRHGGFIVAYSPGADKTIHPRLTAILGPGRIQGTTTNENGIEEQYRDRMFVGQVMGGAELNLFQWFRLGIEGGYRFASGVEAPVVTASDVSGAVVQIEARFGFSW